MVIGRFAPSPSGRMHLGNVLAALCAWLSVRSQGGRMLLRIEDLDPERSRPEHAEALMRDLDWLGLCWDARAPNQSTRAEFYQGQLDRLAAKGLVYPCFCSRAQLHAAGAPHAADGQPVYDGRCARLSAGAAAAMALRRAPALRLRVPDESICFEDRLQGPCCENLARACGDFIVRRSDGVFAYQLAAPCDDAAGGVTEVVRGRDLLASTPRQMWLLRTLGYAPPRYAHLPLLLAPDGRRLSKRERDLDVGALRARGKTPQEITGALAWLCGLANSPLPVAAEGLVKSFDMQRICKTDRVVPPDFLL